MPRQEQENQKKSKKSMKKEEMHKDQRSQQLLKIKGEKERIEENNQILHMTIYKYMEFIQISMRIMQELFGLEGT